MDRSSVFPQFQKPRGEYDRAYFDNMINMLNVLMVALRNPGEGRQTTMVLTNLPTNDYNLEPGGLFQVDGALRVSILSKAYVAGLSATGRVGSVTVTTV